MNLNSILESLVRLGTTWGLRIIGVLVALYLAGIVSRWLQRKIVRGLEKKNFDATLTKFFGAVARYAVMTGAAIGCLGVFGIETTSFAAGIAAMGLAVGMALQGTLGNFAAGVMLLIFRPFKIGDLIKTAGELGVVKEIELFTTQLDTADNRRLIIPNGAIFGKVIENISFHSTRRVDISVGTTYDGKTEDVRAVLERIPSQVDGVLKDPAPQIFLAELGGSSVDWKVRLWCNSADYWNVHQKAIQAIKHNLDEANIGIPYPQMDVHFDADFTGKKAA